MRHAKLVRGLVVAAVVLLGLGAAADVIALQLAESRSAAGFAQATAAERVAVDLGGFPFIPRLLLGRLARLELDARGLSGGGLRVERLHVEVRDIRFSPGGALAVMRSEHASRTRVTVASPVGRAEITQSDLGEFLRARHRGVYDVRVVPSGVEVRFRVDPATVSSPARFLPRVEGRRLVLTLVGFADAPRFVTDQARSVERSIDLPPIPEGLTVDVSLGNGSFTLEASGPQVDVLVGEGGVRSA